jgi:DMSO/TMAO reductase YedYZ molybdopterin-dependent catalytic subunit
VKLPRSPFPEDPPPGPTRPEFWKSPLRGPWLSSFLGSALLPLVVICAVTGFLSQVAYSPQLGDNNVLPPGGLGWDVFPFDWPTRWAFLYAVTQGLHVTSGVIAIPLLLAKLWSVMPKLFEWPPVRSVSHLLERISLALLVGGALFVFFTGLMNIQLYYPWNFSFVPSHYYAAFVFLAALALHVGLKFPTVRRSFREQGVLRPLKYGLRQTEPEPYRPDSTVALAPAAPTVSRRALLTTVAATSVGLGFMMAAQTIGGPLRSLALLAPRGRDEGSGPNDFPVNKTAEAVGITPAQTGADWRLELRGGQRVELSREQLLAMPQYTYRLPIGCVEGWSTTQDWTGVRLRDLAAVAGVATSTEVLVQSMQEAGSFNKATLSAAQIDDDRSLLALKVNGVDLSMDHGFPARVIVPALPGVHCTKWVSSMEFKSA